MRYAIALLLALALPAFAAEPVRSVPELDISRYAGNWHEIGHLPANACHVGGAVEIMGPHQDADALGAAAGSIGYEVLTSLGKRAQRRILPVKA